MPDDHLQYSESSHKNVKPFKVSDLVEKLLKLPQDYKLLVEEVEGESWNGDIIDIVVSPTNNTVTIITRDIITY